jgi:hypothetical protein
MPIILVVLTLSPLFFGSVHTPAWLTFSCLILVSGFLYMKNDPISKSAEYLGLWCLSIAIYGLCQLLWGTLFKVPLPIDGIALGIPNQQRMESTIFSFTVSSVFFFTLARVKSLHTLRNTVIYSGLIVSLVALTHWLGDDGKLFWFFEPNTISPSNRARWPFVNPNHLGAFLIFPFFFVVEEFFIRLTNLKNTVSRDALKSPSSRLSVYLSSPILPSLLVTATKTLLLGVTILASFSRGVIVPLSIFALIGVVHFSFSTGSRFGSFSLWITLIFTLSTVFALLDHKEILEARLVYGLVAAVDDLRWIMLRESLSLLYQHPIFGVGLGTWEEHFFGVASTTFVGLRPEYLHSDTAQFLIETGVVGALITIFFVIKTIKSATIFRGKSIFPELAILSFLTSSTLDFPLRIPSVTWLAIASITIVLSSGSNDVSPERSAETKDCQ